MEIKGAAVDSGLRAQILDRDGPDGLLVLEDNVKEEKMGLWWLLLIALFGEAGREMYVKHKKKQEEKAKIDE